MKKIGFIYCSNPDWIGGENYYKSVISELSREISKADVEIRLVIFSDHSTNLDFFTNMESVEIRRTRFLSNNLVIGFLRRFTDKIFFENAFLFPIFRINDVSLLSHAYLPESSGIKSLPWIPDFQHCYLKDLFSEKMLRHRDKQFNRYLSSHRVLVSSNTAMHDAIKFYNAKAHIYRYRFLPLLERSEQGYDFSEAEQKLLEGTSPIVFLPNQFWKHKNHLTVIKACVLAKERNIDFKLICTGRVSDFRGDEHISEIFEIIERESLKNFVHILGVVDRELFISILDKAEIVINPSNFEGWSSTVEEGKGKFKKLALSDIEIHREQTIDYSDVAFFEPSDPEKCLDAIETLLSKKNANLIISPNRKRDSMLNIYKSIFCEQDC
ncbi:glycosyltransferase [Vibrio cholerae]|uniref:glycosyltransferase n=1 Tax=Vibrio cholerae TaxID=666 RepID=UPI0018F0C421|nr:glycosyltransferase [Vibrio cholerae]MBJ6879706.1 glycosyltransferase [Vibrio cholerae]MBJ6883403.1 glycosyltransferase [Vibrio cholerae]MBJ6890762.1 glycosyltransferase [Vibrio cholerae]